MDKKLSTFLEIAQTLNKHDIIPTVYGSLGLYRLVGQLEEINDIDITVPNINLVDKFVEFKKIMEEIGFNQDPNYMYEFIKGEKRVGVELEDELTDWGIDIKNLKITEIEGVCFKELSAEDYLKVYNENLKTWEKKVISIKNKISAIEKLISQKKK